MNRPARTEVVRVDWTDFRGPWFAEHIKFDHGPLVAGYYLWGDGQDPPGAILYLPFFVLISITPFAPRNP